MDLGNYLKLLFQSWINVMMQMRRYPRSSQFVRNILGDIGFLGSLSFTLI